MLMSIPGRPTVKRGSIPDACLLDLVNSDLDRVKQIVTEAGLDIVGLYCGGIDPSSADGFQASVQNLADGARVAEELGCRHLGHGGGRSPSPGLATEAKLPLVQRLGNIVDAVATEYDDVLFAVDAHYHGVIESVADCDRYIDELEHDRAGILLNTGHMTTCNQPGWDVIEQRPNRVPVIGWKDHTPDPEGERPFLSVELGTGDTDLERYVEAARGQDADRIHVINVESATIADTPDALRASLEYMNAVDH